MQTLATEIGLRILPKERSVAIGYVRLHFFTSYTGPQVSTHGSRGAPAKPTMSDNPGRYWVCIPVGESFTLWNATSKSALATFMSCQLHSNTWGVCRFGRLWTYAISSAGAENMKAQSLSAATSYLISSQQVRLSEDQGRGMLLYHPKREVTNVTRSYRNTRIFAVPLCCTFEWISISSIEWITSLGLFTTRVCGQPLVRGVRGLRWECGNRSISGRLSVVYIQFVCLEKSEEGSGDQPFILQL